MTKWNKTHSKVILIILIVSTLFSGCINNEYKNESINITSNISVTPIPSVISTPQITPTITPEETPIPEPIHIIEIIDETITIIQELDRTTDQAKDNVYIKKEIIGSHKNQINNILNHTDSNITKYINRIEVYDNLSELNLYCNNYNIVACTDGKNIAIIKSKYYGTTTSYYINNYGDTSTTTVLGNFNETLIHMIGYVKGINLYNDNSKAFADEYLNEKYTAEFGYHMRIIYDRDPRSGNYDYVSPKINPCSIGYHHTGDKVNGTVHQDELNKNNDNKDICISNNSYVS